MSEYRTLLDIGSSGQRLRVSTLGLWSDARIEADILDVVGELTDGRIAVEAHPFSGEIAAPFAEAEITAFSSALDDLRRRGNATIGGGRGFLVALELDDGVIDVTVMPSEDDPQVTLRYLISGAQL